MIILGISAYYHDSAACLVKDGKVICAAEEERFSRVKHDKGFPSQAIEFCLTNSGVSADEVDCVVFYEKPIRKFERILHTHIQYAPFGLCRFVKSMPSWLKTKLNMRNTIKKQLRKIDKTFSPDIRFIPHHQSHAAWAFFQSGKCESAVLVVDAVGESMTTSIWKGRGKTLECLRYQEFPHSLGLLYSAATYFLGFKVNSDEYKVMGLAPYCSDLAKSTKFQELIHRELVRIEEDGQIQLNTDNFNYMVGDTMCQSHRWETLFGLNRRLPDSKISDEHIALAHAFQVVTEDVLTRLSKTAMRLAVSSNLCIAGGVSLNCSAIGYLKRQFGDENVFVPFAPGDDGGAIGAALSIAAFEGDNIEPTTPYLGIEFNDRDVELAIEHNGLTAIKMDDERLSKHIAEMLSKGCVVGWYNGRMEFGPRALGNRSILADARNGSMKDKINASVKFRESFRPFAPIVIKEMSENLYGTNNSPYMTSVYACSQGNICQAVTHVDGSARIQTVSNEDNPKLYRLLMTCKDLTGVPVLLNTSFNVMGEPIVCSPEDAIKTFKTSGIEILVLNNFVIAK